MAKHRQETDTQAMARIKQQRRRRQIRRMAVLVLALSLALAYFTGIFGASLTAVSDFWDTVTLSVHRGGGYPMDLSLQNLKGAGSVNGGAALLTKTDFYLFSSTGREALRFQHGYVNPVLSTGRHRVCVYNRFGTALTVASRSRVLFNQTFENAILTAALGQDGQLAVATEASRYYTAQVEVYSREMELVYTWYSASYYPTSLSVSPDGHRLAVACPAVREGSLGSALYFLDTRQDQEVAQVTVDGSTVLGMEYLGAKTLLVVYDDMAAVYNVDTGEESFRYSYEGRTLLRWHAGRGRYLGLAFGDAVQSTGASLEVCNAQLESVCSIPLDGGLQDIFISGSRAFVLGKNQAFSYSFKGELADSWPLGSQGQRLVWAGGALAVEIDGLTKLS